MASVNTYTSAGEQAQAIEIDESKLELAKGAQAVKDTVVAIQNARRAGTASTKGKGEVAGSNKKPWRQKGTGNARAGFRQSPVWRGGGVAHGPKPRDFGVKVNKKVVSLAFRRALSEKIAAGDVLVVEAFQFEAPKTKLFASFLKKLGCDRTALVVTGDFGEDTSTIDNLVRMTCNLPRVALDLASAIDVYDVLRFKKIVTDKAGFDVLMARIEKGAE